MPTGKKDQQGTRRVDGRGYVLVKVGRANPWAMSNGWAYEHRLVMAAKLGRDLLRSESIRHLNGDLGDNGIDNLQLVDTKRRHCPSCSCEILAGRIGG